MPAWLSHPTLEAVGVGLVMVLLWRMLARPAARLTALALCLGVYAIGNPWRLTALEPFLAAALVSIIGYFALFALAGWLVQRDRHRLGPGAPFALLPMLLYPFALFAAALLAHSLGRG